MVRVRRLSRGGSRRTGSESPEHARYPQTRPGGQGGALAQSHHLHNFQAENRTLPLIGSRANRDFQQQPAPSPSELYVGPFHAQLNPFDHQQSPESIISTTSFATSSLGLTSPGSGSTARLERGRNISPDQYTPSQSHVTLNDIQSQDLHSKDISSGAHGDDPNWLFPSRSLSNATSEPLAGINTITARDGNWSFEQQRETAPPNLMIPLALNHMHDLNVPWSPFELGSEELSPSTYSGASNLNRTPRSQDLPLSPTVNSRLNAKPGRRSGPLSHESRQNANDVRKERSCLRCFVMKETCDTSKDACHNCQRKQARTWKLGCVRPRLMFRSEYLLPDMLASRLERGYVDSFIQHKGWTCTDRPRFAIYLDIGLDAPLTLPVREFLPVGDLDRLAFLTVETEDGPKAREVTMYDLPVIISCEEEATAATHIRVCLRRWLDNVLVHTQNNQWAWHWFHENTDAFAGDIMEVICDYHQPSVSWPQPHNELLRDALGLSFFNYIFINAFDIPREYWKHLDSRMENPPRAPPGKPIKYISPSTINLYIKMLMLPPLRDVVKRTLKGLETLLLEQQNTSMWRRDIIFCVSFIIMAYMGKTEISVLQFAHQPVRDNGKIPTHDDAENSVFEMEQNMVDLIIRYHHQFLTPSPRRKQHNVAITEAQQACEEHAIKFGLFDKIQAIRQKHYRKKPRILEPDCHDVEDFLANNTNRVCWKFAESVLGPLQSGPPKPPVKRDPDVEMELR